MERYNVGYSVGQEINQQDLPYPKFGLGKNSNTVASTLLNQMGLEDPDLGSAITPGEGNLFLPEKDWYDDGHHCVLKPWIAQNINNLRSNKAHGYNPLILNLDGKGIQARIDEYIKHREQKGELISDFYRANITKKAIAERWWLDILVKKQEKAKIAKAERDRKKPKNRQSN